MKKNLLIIAMLIFAASTWAQESMFTASYGYVFANPQEFNTDLTGYKVNALFEYNPYEGPLAHGMSIGYVYTTGSDNGTDYKIRTWPIYYQPKYMFGNDKIKGFVKGAIGMHFAKYMYEGKWIAADYNQAGIYAGAGAGAMYNFSQKIFMNLDYEWAFMGNTSEEDVFLNTLSLGIGLRF